MDTVEGNAAGTTLRSLDQTYEAKYVRIWVDKPVQDDNEADPRVRMGRFEFYAEQDPVTSIDGDRSGVYEGSTPGTGSNGTVQRDYEPGYSGCGHFDLFWR